MGIWRIPVDEIDRPGSFASHMNRSIVLLLNVLSQLKDYPTLLKISSMLQRTPDQGKKYLRDADRQVLAQRAFVLTVMVLEEMLHELTEVSEEQSGQGCDILETRMTTDVFHKASAEDGQEPLPPKAALSSRLPYGTEDVAQGEGQDQPLTAMESDEGKPEKNPKVASPSGSAEPMECDHFAAEPEKMEASSLYPEPAQVPSGRICKDKVPESRTTAELSLEDLSISSKHQQLEARKGQAQAGPTEETSQKPNRKRKLAGDTESGKTLLLDAYRVWQQGQKVMTYDLGKIEKIMSETYMLIKQVDEAAALEQAVKFCQVHIGASAQKQSAGDAPTTPKHPRDSRDHFFAAAAPKSLTPPMGTAADTTSSVAEALPRLADQQSKPKATSPSSSSSSSTTGGLLLPPQEPAGVENIKEMPPTSSLKPDKVEESRSESFLAGLQQESPCCQQMKMAAINPSSGLPPWQVELESAGQVGGPASSSKAEHTADGHPLGRQVSKAGSSQVKSRTLPSVPKLFIPPSVSKFPPEITVTPPTPTLLSPKGSISEETKQKLKSAILSAQSAANVKKESLCQPALEVVETSSQESSLESDSEEEGEEEEEEDNDCMDI